MNYLIINSHPYEGSFNRSAAKNIEKILEKKGSCEQIDLVTDGFDPVMRANDLHLWGKGETTDPLVLAYQKKIEWADMVIFLFPVWWGTMPAILKGFCDKVFLPGWAYDNGFAGLLIGKQKKRAVVISTMHTPSPVFCVYFHNPVRNAFLKDTLKSCGFKIAKYMQIGGMAGARKKRTQRAMSKVLHYFTRL